ncbi:MAG: hypothetical protein LQ339_003115 [Xanthoria mediterranea]|nr:MAG: hypothetical protein LQ339_003115 [Xanthoria mediterranea]
MSSDTALPNASALAQIPAVPPPPGVRYDFNGPNPLSYTIAIVASVFVGLTWFFLAIRTYAKVKIHRHWTWDDDIQSPVRSAYEEFLKLSYVSGWLSNVANIFIKLTFFILYWSIFYPFRWLRYAILGGAAVVTGVYAGFIMYMLISDTPRPGQTWLEKAQESEERGKDAEQGKPSDSDRPYSHLKERGFAVSEDGVHNLKPYTHLRTETTITAQPGQDCHRDGIRVHTDFEQA